MEQAYATVTTDQFEITSNAQSQSKMEKALVEPPKDAPKTDPEPAGATEEIKDGSDAQPEAKTTPEGEQKIPRSLAKKDQHARMLEATQQAAQAKRDREAVKAEKDEIEAKWKRDQAELEALRSRMPKDEPKPAPKPAFVDNPEDPAPKEDDFENYAQFVAATARWGARQEHAEITKQSTQKQQADGWRDYQIGKVKQFNERVSERAKITPDLVIPPDVVDLLPKAPFKLDHKLSTDDAIGSYFTTEDKGLDLMVYFGDHLDELAKIRTLPPGRVGIELGRIEGRLNGATTATPEEPEVSKARPPARPVAGGPPSSNDPLDPNISFEEYARRQNELDRKRAKAR